MSGGGANFEAHDYNKGIKIDNNGLEIKGITSFDNDITIGTGTNQIQLSSAGDISGKTLTLSESIDSGTIKVGTGNNQITLDSTTGELKGVFLTTTGRIQAGTGTNQIILNTTNGKILGKTLELTENITAENEALNGTLTVNGITTLNNALYLKNTNHCINTYSLNNKEYLKMNSNGQIEISEAENFNDATYGIKLYSNGNIIKGDTTLYDGNYLYFGSSNHHIRGIGNYFQFVSSQFIEISNNDRFNYASVGIKITSSNRTMQMKGNTTFNNNLTVSGTTSLNSGTISTAPSNNNDIVNKAYVDSVVSGAVDPSITLHLTNSNSLITDGDITSKTMIKTETQNDLSYDILYTIQRNLNNPAGLFYCPSNNKIYTIMSGNNQASYIVIYDINTSSASTIEITDNNHQMKTIDSFDGFYDYSEVIPSYLLITGTDENNEGKYCYYNIKTNTLSALFGCVVNKNPFSKISYDGWIYYYTNSTHSADSSLNYNLVISSIASFYPSRADYTKNLNIPIDKLIPIDSFNNFVIIASGTTIYLYRFFPNNGAFNYQYDEDIENTPKKFIKINENTIIILCSKKIFKAEVVKASIDYELNITEIFDNSSSTYTYQSGINNIDGTLYISSVSTSPADTKIEQFIILNNQIKLNKELSLTSHKYQIKYMISANNIIYSVCNNADNSQYYSLLSETITNKETILSNNQTSLNGVISINKNMPSSADVKCLNINDVLTVGTFFNLMKHFTCSASGNIMNMDYLINNTFINSDKFNNSS